MGSTRQALRVKVAFGVVRLGTENSGAALTQLSNIFTHTKLELFLCSEELCTLHSSFLVYLDKAVNSCSLQDL